MIDDTLDADIVISYLNIEDLIQHYRLKGRITDNRFLGCCPLHNDKNPSFSLDLERYLWLCWGCDEKGNVFQLISKLEEISYKESIEWLGKFVGLSSNYTPSLDYCNRLLAKLNSSFTEKDEELPTVNLPKECESAIKHLRIAKKRVDANTIRKYNIKYAASGFYKGSIIIPIVFEKKMVAFFARDLLGIAEKTKRYNKGAKTSRIFFNWDDAIQYRDYVIVVEGILDCIKICNWGYNCVALLGTHLSITKRNLLLKYFDSIIIVLDNDYKEKFDANGDLIISNPGQAAAEKLVTHFKDESVIYNAVLPVGKDPDECTLSEFEETLKHAKRYN